MSKSTSALVSTFSVLAVLLLSSAVTCDWNNVGSDDDGDAEVERSFVDRLDGHLAHYITMSKITFSDLQRATAALEDIVSGRRNFMNVANEEAVNNARGGRQNAALQNGDLGLITYDLLEEELAQVAFDIRQPLAKGAGDILGPVCTRSGCSLMAVFSRFRKSFFSQAWFEAENYCKDNDLTMSDIISRLNTDEMSMVASVVWPDEHVTFRKIKIRELKGDLKKLNEVDPSTVFKPEHQWHPARRDLTEHNRLMTQREAIFREAGQAVMEAHPEIYAMSIPQMMASGFIPSEAFRIADEELAKLDAESAEARAAHAAAIEKVNKYKLKAKKGAALHPVDGCSASDTSASCGGSADLIGADEGRTREEDL
jgi:hypothetical protein